jgi:hypothetical protein
MSRARHSYFERLAQGGGRTMFDYGRTGPIARTRRHSPPAGANDYRMPDMRKALLCAAMAWAIVIPLLWGIWTVLP